MKTILLILTIGCWSSCLAAAAEPGLLFYLSGDHEFTADYAAGGDPQPNFLRGVKLISDGALGRGFECANTQLMSYWAPGNIYAERGTLSFFWRSRYPVGPTAFPIFRVGYADHSSWDMVWLRIDYNGHGFDAFVTDVNLSRIRVSYAVPQFPKPNEWTHLALAWDERSGIRFYVNGVLAARQEQSAVLYAGLDQFGPFSRTIGPMQVQSDYNFTRGGDIDEVRIYDRMLSDANVASLAKSVTPQQIPSLTRTLDDKAVRDEWMLRYGWNRKNDVPPYLSAPQTSIRKVEILEAYDLKRWWWKATDGIRETTWPGVYNRSRLPGRNDYFQLPDWDCYSLSGKAITFNLPDEPWNHLEISGAAWGKMYLEGAPERTLFERPKGQEKTFHDLPNPIRGQKIRFENVEQEEPIGELSAYYVAPGKEPTGSARLIYRLRADAGSNDAEVEAITKFISGRYTSDERSTIIAAAEKDSRTNVGAASQPQTSATLPLVHVIIPASGWKEINDGLDGIAIDLPPLEVKPVAGAYLPLNIQVKDPLWPQRNLLDFSFSVKPNEARTLWLDTRDRILPEGRAIYLTIAAGSADFGVKALDGARVRLIFKPRAEATKEHEIDRFTQARDSYAMLIEEHTNNPRLNLYNRFAADITDVLRVNPNHWLAQTYWYDSNRSHPKPAFTQPAPPAGVPLWAFRQVTQLRNLSSFVNWYIDNRQIENGEFGGGLSDDGDLTNVWPGTALMGCDPEKLKESLKREMDAFYREGMFTNGLPTIQADELHSYEEGIQVLGQTLLLDYGDPKQIERAMETSRSVIKLTGINSAGHRHIRSSYYNGNKMAEEEPWGYAKPSSILVLHPGIMLVDYNGNPQMKQIITELADGFLAHRKKDASGRASLSMAIRFADDQEIPNNRGSVLPVLWVAWKWTGDEKYLAPFRDEGARALDLIPSNALDELGVRATWGNDLVAAIRTSAGNQGSRQNGESPNSQRLNVPPPPNFGALHFAWQTTGDKSFLESLYAAQIETSALRQYMNTDGSMWIDRVDVPNSELQRARLGGIALVRGSLYPGHAVSWNFAAPARAEDVAILIRENTPQSVKLVAYNLSAAPVTASLTPWNLEPGKWEMMQGIDTHENESADEFIQAKQAEFGQFECDHDRPLTITLAPRATTVIVLQLRSKGTPYWSRPDLGIGTDDLVIRGSTVSVTVHSLGAVDAPASKLSLLDADGKVVASVTVPPLKAPLDLMPKTATVTLNIPNGVRLTGGSVMLDPDGTMKEITRVNNSVRVN